MTHKKVPGADWVYMVYDSRDRLVMTQDGEQRKNDGWTYTKYDQLNRPIVTGLYTHTGRIDQESMSTLVLSLNPYETFDGTGTSFGYTDNVFPSSSFGGTFEPLTVIYYDNYDFIYNDGYFGYKTGELTGQYQSATGTAVRQVVGLVTGTWTRMLGKDKQWLRQVNYYDDKNRVVQTISDNHKRGQDITTTVYDFQGKATATKTGNIEHRLFWGVQYPGAWVSEDRVRTLSGSTAPVHVYSSQEIGPGANGWVEFTCSADNGAATNRWFGFSTSTAADNVEFSVLQAWTPGPAVTTVQVSESGVLKSGTIPAQAGDVIRIERKGTTMYYSKNGVIFYSSTLVTTSALYAHGKIYLSNAGLYNPKMSVAGKVRSTERKFEYDHAGRLTNTWHSIDGAIPVLLSHQQYNELGQLTDKKLHSADSVSFRQSIDYRYNIRGWLTSMNGAGLAQNSKNMDDATDRRDLFGMDLLYNEVETGLSGSGAFNGNISAMKTSYSLGLASTKQRAYNFTYDPMNRLTDATQKTYTMLWNGSNAFKENALTYDLNGNIKTLTRTGANGITMDQLSYNYGDNENASNMLRKIDDAGTPNGFSDVAGDYDYNYDSNGNLTMDVNKGITSITYNHLNLPDKVVKNTGDYLTYTYDATGRKLFQDLYQSDGTLKKRSDYRGEWFYEKDTLRFVNHEEGRLVVDGDWIASPQLYPDPDINTTAGSYISWSTSGTTVSAATVNGQTYVKAVSTQSSGSTGILGGFLTVIPGRKYTIKMKGYRTTATPARLYVAHSGSAGSGDLVWAQAPALPNGSANEGWITATTTIPSTSNRIRIGVLWPSPVQAGDTFYVNNIEVYEYNDLHGKAVFSEAGYTYQYHLKDHLGNVRMTFTTKDELDSATATLERDHIGEDRSNFLNYDDARLVYSKLLNHTRGDSSGYSQRLSGSANEKIGLAKSLSVMPGDVIRAEVYAKYFDRDDQNLAGALQTVLNYLLNPAGSGGKVVDGSAYSSASSLTVPWGGGEGTQPDANVPKAFLNYLWINRAYDTATVRFKSKPISAAAFEDGTNRLHELLEITDTVSEAGYVYIYLNNDGEGVKEVYFDDFKVEHVKSPVVSSQDYYPFGLAFNSYQREDELNDPFQYNGKEMQDEGGLGWLDYGARMYEPLLGRFMTQDAFAEKFLNFSPYQYGANNPIKYVDINGDSIFLSEAFLKNETFVSAFKQFMGTKQGKAFLSKYAAKGQEILGVKFDEEGSLNGKGVNISYGAADLGDESTHAETGVSQKENGIDIGITMNTKDKMIGEDGKPLSGNHLIFGKTTTLFHESFIHADLDTKDYLDDGQINSSNISAEAKKDAGGVWQGHHYQHSAVRLDYKKNGYNNMWPGAAYYGLKTVNERLKTGYTDQQIVDKMWNFSGAN